VEDFTMHTVYLAKSIRGIANGKYVLKRYKEDKVNEIKELHVFGTTEAQKRRKGSGK